MENSSTIPTLFLEDLQREGLSAHTLRAYRSDLSNFERWFEESNGEPFTPEAVTRTDLLGWRSYQQTTASLKPATINRRLATLRCFFRWAKTSKLVADNPVDDVPNVPASPLPPRSLTRQELNRLTRSAERHGTDRNFAIIQLLRYTGIRVGELCALTKDDIQLSERKGMLTVRSGKGGKYRQVPLNAEARRALGAHLDAQPQGADDHLFIGQRGGGLSPWAVHDIVRNLAQSARLEGVTPHVLRHSFGRALVADGVDLVTVARLMGHARLDTTMVYTQPNRQELINEVERLGVSSTAE